MYPCHPRSFSLTSFPVFLAMFIAWNWIGCDESGNDATNPMEADSGYESEENEDEYFSDNEDNLDTDEMIKRFKDRAAAVKKRDLPPVGGEERQRFIAQAQTDFQDFAIIGDSIASFEDGFLVLRIDLRSGSS